MCDLKFYQTYLQIFQLFVLKVTGEGAIHKALLNLK